MQNPIATNDTYTTTINTPIIVNPLSNDSDSDGDPIFISKINGTFVIAWTPYIITGWIVTVSTTWLMNFRPTMSFVWTSTILYTLSDWNWWESVASVSVNTTMPAWALECNKLYATSISNTTSIVRYDPITNTATNETITLDGRTRSSALTLDGTRIYYIDDNNAGGTLEYLDVPSNTTTVTSYVLPAKFQTVSRTFTYPWGSFTYTVWQSATRMWCSKNWKCYMLFWDNQDLVNRATIVPPNTVTQNWAKQVLLEIDPLTNTVTEIGSLIDVPGNTVSVDALAWWDIMFDDSDKAYVIDNNGQFFKINISTLEWTYLSLMNWIAWVVPAWLAYSVLWNPYYFSAAWTSPRNIAEINLITNTATVRTSVPTQMWDAFSCAFPVLTSQPNMPKSFYKIVWADINWLWWNREFSSEIIPWDIIEFEIVIRNIGKLPLLNTRFYDNIPAWSSYILWTSK
jgi:uncharacterized repeat protein (TIGR01451 family)